VRGKIKERTKAKQEIKMEEWEMMEEGKEG